MFTWPRLYDLLLLILTRGRARAYRQDLLDLAGVEPGDRVLDIGCGTGTQAIAAHGRARPDGQVVGVDASLHMLAAARRKARRAGFELTFERADATALPFPDNHFDVVTITTVLHELPGDRRRPCLEEAARVLRSGGRLVVVDFAGEPAARKSWIARQGAHGRFDLHDLGEVLPSAGFEAIDKGPVDWLGLHFLRGTKRRAIAHVDSPDPRSSSG